ncbi:MAG: L-threonylcarbamoyladenylate synthase [Fluviibacter sp.]
MPEIASGQSLEAIDHAVALLNAGLLIGMPTETVYGLAADADNADAVASIFVAKGRPADHPLIVHLGADDLLGHYAREIPEAAWTLAEAFWPGPLTMILKKAPDVSDVVTGGQDTVGVRMPGHPVALSLLRAFAEAKRLAGKTGGGLAAPSANRFGRISPTAAQHVADELGNVVPLILDGGDCQVGIESTIVDLSRGKPEILRPGAITADQLSLVLGEPVVTRAKQSPDAPRVSGSLASHYAPLTPLVVADVATITQASQDNRVAVIAREGAGLSEQSNVVILPNHPGAYAHDFYRVLRELDAQGYEKILVQALPDTVAWFAVQDRLGRAAHRELSDNG